VSFFKIQTILVKRGILLFLYKLVWGGYAFYKGKYSGKHNPGFIVVEG